MIIATSTSSSSPDSDNSQDPINSMNNQPVNDNQIGDDENRGRPVEDDESFMSRTLLDYAAPQATNARGPIKLSRLTEDPLSYDASTISILQNN
jgi:hypothetical protein